MPYKAKYRELIRAFRHYSEALYRVARELRRDFFCERVSIYFKDRHRQFVTVLAEGLEGMDLAVKEGEGLVGKCLQFRRPIIANDPLHDPRALSRLRDYYSGYRTKSLLTVPILNAFGRPVGAVQLLNHLGAGFTLADLAHLVKISRVLVLLRGQIPQPFTNIWTAAKAAELEDGKDLPVKR